MKTALRIALLLNMVILPGLLSAHPMGNFSINHHSTIHISPDVISVTTILDFAEIATFQMFPDPRKAADYANDWAAHLHLRANGKSLPLQVQGIRSEIVPAPAGLPTLRVRLQTTKPMVSSWTRRSSR
jgi:nickel/cobalt exporter